MYEMHGERRERQLNHMREMKEDMRQAFGDAVEGMAKARRVLPTAKGQFTAFHPT